jgi:hypothetical protein
MSATLFHIDDRGSLAGFYRDLHQCRLPELHRPGSSCQMTFLGGQSMMCSEGNIPADLEQQQGYMTSHGPALRQV